MIKVKAVTLIVVSLAIGLAMPIGLGNTTEGISILNVQADNGTVLEGTIGTDCHWTLSGGRSEKTLTISGDNGTLSGGASVADSVVQTIKNSPELLAAWRADDNTDISTFPNVVKHLVLKGSLNTGKDASRLFSGMSSLTDIEGLTNLKTEDAESMEGMFSNTEVDKLDLSSFRTSKVKTMANMFMGVPVKSLDVSNFDTENVEDMSGMFSGVLNIRTLDLTNFCTDNVTTMARMFDGTDSLTSLNLSKFNTERVTDMSSMFAGLGVTTLNLKNFKTINVTSMSYMFSETPQLRTIEFDKTNFDTRNVQSMMGMFSGCSGLQSLDLSSFNTSKVTNMYAMFQRFNVDSGTLDLSNFDTSLVTTMSYMFGDSQLKKVNLSSFDTTNVHDFGHMFSNAKNLTQLNLSNFRTSAAMTDISDKNDVGMGLFQMFYRMDNLTDLNISNFEMMAPDPVGKKSQIARTS